MDVFGMSGNSDPKARLVDGNSRFSKTVDHTHMTQLAKKQEPFVAILSCADSRVDPAKIFSLSLGDAFIVRLAGNTASDPSIIGSLEYAVSHLHVKALLVLGHSDCGAARLAIEGSEGSEAGNLHHVMWSMHNAMVKLPNGKEKDPVAVAEMNVKLQMRLLVDGSSVIREALNQERLTLLGAMFDISTGTVRFV